ncbi:tRNA pseudouridine(38-40) synthase TruA [Roseospirillum parvum]|uniref:tRNA pseudouridine synthase A n=1 Tax=Roseospirillum parvum TaxID=83401 RepID=A0A1G7ZEC5_9PROT|nr:tRNA pseudouridine(38-40) synthase TruA [Roseospirillum parvum]SDH07123.1 tRNA pseudouridine38-40 synthase [Roseospirillum parvum]
MPRFRLILEYDGAAFVGWQRQDNGDSVQAALEAAALAYSGGAVQVLASGRTDSGVHALAQVAHLDLPRDDPPQTVRNALNAHLKPAPVAVLDCQPVADDFHARFSCLGRCYLYRILERPAPLVLARGRAWWVPPGRGGRLDAEAMAEAATHLLGRHDFTSFRASQCQADSPLRTLDGLSVRAVEGGLEIRAWARSFLHHQVRNMVGTLKLVGQGKLAPGEVAIILAARDRARAGPTAPPEGLYFAGALYPDAALVGADFGAPPPGWADGKSRADSSR